MKKHIAIFLIIFPLYLFSQNNGHYSIHQIELAKYDSIGDQNPEFWRKYFGFKKIHFQENKGCKLNHIVFGWHPYWSNGLEDNYQWSYLSDLAYFAYEVDPSTGDALSTHNWENTAVVDSALSKGVRVHLTATLFGNHDQFFGNQSAVQNLINNLVSEVAARNANGINIDFEGMGSDNKDDFTQFIADLRAAMDNVDTNWILSICLYAVDWNHVFDIPALVPNVDYFIIMGYDYYYAGSSEAGPTGQLYTMHSFDRNQSRTVTYYKHAGVPENKLVLGVPYYGFDWPTQSSSVPSSTTGTGTSKTIKVVKANYSNPHIEPNSLSEYYVYYDNNNNTWRQCWVDDETTMKYKYKMVLQQGLAGIAIWALGYDDGYTQMWDLIRDYFSQCAITPCKDTIWDLGGPNHNYYANENFVYTIKPTGAKNLSLSFSEFNLEAGYDSLYIYDGTSINSPLIGGYSGTNSPGTINASGNALTLKFHSDGATQNAGFTAVWQCTPDDIIPTTSINAPTWVSHDFDATYNDNDNIALKYRFYQVLDFNGSQWRANSSYGYLYDDFSSTNLSAEWHQITGNWYISNGYLRQDDETSSNTNIYINLRQDTSHIYLYSWKMRISGSGSNRRAGFHFFCQDPTQSGRLNSYMVYLRVDNNKAQIYKYIDNNYHLMANEPCIINANTWYNYKLIFNPKTGEIYLFQNNNLIAKWIDPDPWTSGGYLSLRTGNCIADYDDIRVYKIRNTSTTITVGTNKELRYQNPDPSQPAGQIISLVVDDNFNFSDTARKFVNVDTSAPSPVSCLSKKVNLALDTTDSVIHVHWCPAIDPQSYISRYWYAVGTSPLDTNVIPWQATQDTFAVISDTNLQEGEIYYVSVKAENICGLIGPAVSTDGTVIYYQPHASINISDTTVCQFETITLQADTNHITNYLWTITNGDTLITSTSPRINITFYQSGNYDIKLKVCNQVGCDSLFMPQIITVIKHPIANFTASDTVGTAPLTVSFYNNSQYSTKYLWSFGDGYISTDFEPAHSYIAPGIYSVSLIASNDICADTTLKNEYIHVLTPSYAENSTNIILYPNPSTEKLTFSNELSGFRYKLINYKGKIVQTGIIKHNNINIASLKPGIYLLQIITDKNALLYKVIKQ